MNSSLLAATLVTVTLVYMFYQLSQGPKFSTPKRKPTKPSRRKYQDRDPTVDEMNKALKGVGKREAAKTAKAKKRKLKDKK